MGRTARLAAASPRVGFTALSPGGIHRSVPGWDPPLCPPGGLHRSAGRCRSLGAPHRPAGRCRSPVGLYRSVPRMGRTARWSLPVPGWAIPFGPRMGRTARWSLPVQGWTIPLGPPGGPHRPAGRYRSPNGPHCPQVAAGPWLGYNARSPGWAAPPS